MKDRGYNPKSEKNMLLRFYSINAGEYGEPFAICDAGYHALKQKWSDAGLIVEKVGTTEWACNNHEDHKRIKSPIKKVRSSRDD